ncbi:MAG: 16S rRNA (cytosine(1402)-N(4))-methyltransferase RsmH [bacterium]|nr:16S rRNA (cytosine(1402)-N(4))-methyltransferase RsmH [bacterium]
MTEGHRPVLLHESLEKLDIQSDDVVLDATLGGAGHAREIVAKLGAKGTFIGIDADGDAIKRAEEALNSAKAKVVLLEGNFRDVESYLGKHGIPHLTKALFDLGWSGYQLASGRGFSFLKDEPLLMTYSSEIGENTLTAGKIVNTWKEESIADVIYGWGEENFSRQIAKGIIEARKKKPIATSRELAAIISDSVPAFYRRGRRHPATKTFQGLRIAVNDEMGSLKEGLSSVWNVLKSEGRLAVISFHSIEDREVKRLMLEWSRDGSGERITKSPIRPSREEVLANPRSRSAKLRVIRKL